MVVYNKDQRSKDYSNIKDVYRPGHADFTFDMKYGFRDYRGGGRSSGRETIGRVAAGAVAAKVLEELGISVKAYAKAIAGIEISEDRFDLEEMNNNPFNMPDKEAADLVAQKADQMIKEQDSIGGIIECQITGMPVGIGETVFDKLDAELSKAIMSIGAVKGFEIGDGFEAANLRGSENNDDFACVDGKVVKETNHSGGVLGGMSDGSTIIFRAAVKPTPSIARTQKTINRDLDNVDIEIHGRHWLLEGKFVLPVLVIHLIHNVFRLCLPYHLRNILQSHDLLYPSSLHRMEVLAGRCLYLQITDMDTGLWRSPVLPADPSRS